MNTFSNWDEVPLFDSEQAEAAFWAENRPDLRLMESAVVAGSELSESVTITMRIDPRMLARIKRLARSRYLNYQSMIKQWLSERMEEELREMKDAIAKWYRHPADDSRAGSPGHEVADEIGDVLFAVVNLARKCRIDAESALQTGTDKFVTRFNRVEDELRRQGKRLGDVDLAEMDKIWDRIKMTKQK